MSQNLRQFNNFNELASFIWNIADLLRGNYKQSEYGKVILPMTVLRRLDCVLEPTKAQVLAEYKALKGKPDSIVEAKLRKASGFNFYNTSDLDFARVLSDPDNVHQQLEAYIDGFSANVQDIFRTRFKFTERIKYLRAKNLLFRVVEYFSEVDLHPDTVSNLMMGYAFEELIRRFAEASNETAGEHFTPREVIRLMVDLIFAEDFDALMQKGTIRTLYDPASGTGGMLSIAEEYLKERNAAVSLQVFGQELNDESYAICKSDMMVKGQDPDNIVAGDSFANDGHSGKTFDYMLSNPPFGVKWEYAKAAIEKEHKSLGMHGRFGPGLPRINDGALLFLMHMLSKAKATGDGSRMAIVFNGSPLFTGEAGSGESNIRKWIIENDWLEAIVGLPDQLFYNTGISTYVWVLSTNKPKERRGKVQLINAVDLFQKMKKSLGDKRKELGNEHIQTIHDLFIAFEENERSKIFRNEDFGYYRITVERPLKLAFEVTDERIEALREAAAFQKLSTSKKKKGSKAHDEEVALGEKLQQSILSAVEKLRGESWKSRDAFEKTLNAKLKAAGVKIGAPVKKAIIGALGERDEQAEVCTDSKGNPEPDSELRDYENIPLTFEGLSDADTIIDAYMKAEVLPHVPDAWVDHSKTKIGYEIPFTRHFYEYTPLRPLREIESEIAGLEDEIRASLEGVLG